MGSIGGKENRRGPEGDWVGWVWWGQKNEKDENGNGTGNPDLPKFLAAKKI